MTFCPCCMEPLDTGGRCTGARCTAATWARPVAGDTVEPMPPPGTWLPVAKTFVHRCCGCGARHRWQVRVTEGHVEVRITPLEREP